MPMRGDCWWLALEADLLVDTHVMRLPDTRRQRPEPGRRWMLVPAVAALGMLLGGCRAPPAPNQPAHVDAASPAHQPTRAEQLAAMRAEMERAEPPTPEQIKARQLEDLRRADLKFLAEPVDTAWATASEAAIAAVLTEGHLADQGAPAPVSHHATCRSKTCRIDATYANEMESDIGQAFLIGDLAPRLPLAQMLPFRQPEGKIQFVIYARAPPARPPHPPAGATAH